MPGIGLITNPRSRANRRDPSRVGRFGQLVGRFGLAEATPSFDHLYRACEAYQKEGIEVLAISGGDGTLHHTLTALIQTYARARARLPKIAILRGGTMNTIARSLGIVGETPDLLLHLVERHRTGRLQTFPQPLLQVGDRFGFIFGCGIIHHFLEEYDAQRDPSPATAARLVGAVVASMLTGGPLARRVARRVQLEVADAGGRWTERDFIALAAGVVEQIGLGFRPFYRVREREGAFPVVAFHTDLAGTVRELGRIYLGLPVAVADPTPAGATLCPQAPDAPARPHTPGVIDRVVTALALAPAGSGPLEYAIDGDRYATRAPLLVRLGPRLEIVRLSGPESSPWRWGKRP